MGICNSLAADGCDMPDQTAMATCRLRTLAELSSGSDCEFFLKPRVSARIFTDAKIDDALFLYTFFLINLRRSVRPTARIDHFHFMPQTFAGLLAMVVGWPVSDTVSTSTWACCRPHIKLRSR